MSPGAPIECHRLQSPDDQFASPKAPRRRPEHRHRTPASACSCACNQHIQCRRAQRGTYSTVRLAHRVPGGSRILGSARSPTRLVSGSWRRGDGHVALSQQHQWLQRRVNGGPVRPAGPVAGVLGRVASDQVEIITSAATAVVRTLRMLPSKTPAERFVALDVSDWHPANHRGARRNGGKMTGLVGLLAVPAPSRLKLTLMFWIGFGTSMTLEGPARWMVA